MEHHNLKAWLTTLEEKPHLRRACSLSIVGWIAFLAFSGPALAAQDARVEQQTQEMQKCDALAGLNLEATPGGPAVITSAHITEVPATGLEHFIFTQSGYGSLTPERASRIREYCNVTGYVAPQNKFVLKLPLPSDWNQKFFFYACGGFCGTLFHGCSQSRSGSGLCIRPKRSHALRVLSRRYMRHSSTLPKGTAGWWISTWRNFWIRLHTAPLFMKCSQTDWDDRPPF